MIPKTFISIAEAEYIYNVTQFISLGEGKKLTPRQICSIKERHTGVADWFEQLDTNGQLRVMGYLREEQQRSYQWNGACHE